MIKNYILIFTIDLVYYINERSSELIAWHISFDFICFENIYLKTDQIQLVLKSIFDQS